MVVQSLALIIVAASGAFLIGVGVLGLVRPVQAQRFFLGFATSARKHYLEVAVRMLVGAAFVVAAPRMAASVAASVVGWVLLATTVIMLLVPWRMHRAFAERTVPKALGYLPLLAVSSVAAGAAIIWSLRVPIAA
jgi:hypothetical protein